MPFEGRMGGKTEEAFLRSKNKMYKSGELDGRNSTQVEVEHDVMFLRVRSGHVPDVCEG